MKDDQKSRVSNISSNMAFFRVICYKQKEKIWGLIHNAFFENPITYTDFGDLLIKLNWMCDELQFPAAAM